MIEKSNYISSFQKLNSAQQWLVIYTLNSLGMHASICLQIVTDMYGNIFKTKLGAALFDCLSIANFFCYFWLANLVYWCPMMMVSYRWSCGYSDLILFHSHCPSLARSWDIARRHRHPSRGCMWPTNWGRHKRNSQPQPYTWMTHWRFLISSKTPAVLDGSPRQHKCIRCCWVSLAWVVSAGWNVKDELVNERKKINDEPL